MPKKDHQPTEERRGGPDAERSARLRGKARRRAPVDDPPRREDQDPEETVLPRVLAGFGATRLRTW
jgi:hypothetical protein